jgi:hypothetical protein
MSGADVINDIVPVFDEETGTLTLNVTKSHIDMPPSGPASTTGPTTEAVEVDLSSLEL